MNNGNVGSQTITVPGLAHPFVQSYSYDEFNRLSWAMETHNGSTLWYQMYSIDQFGNRNVAGASAGRKKKGLGGNYDCGQMSAWFIFSSLGFYPVAPGSDRYYLGSPAVKSAVIRLESGRSFTVEALNQSDSNIYVSKVLLNGRILDRRYITHAEIISGGKLTFHMIDRPPVN